MTTVHLPRTTDTTATQQTVFRHTASQSHGSRWLIGAAVLAVVALVVVFAVVR